MKELIAGFMPRWQDFLNSYGWPIVAFLLGALITMIVWMVKHPEDFYTIEEEEKKDEEPVRADE